MPKVKPTLKLLEISTHVQLAVRDSFTQAATVGGVALDMFVEVLARWYILYVPNSRRPSTRYRRGTVTLRASATAITAT